MRSHRRMLTAGIILALFSSAAVPAAPPERPYVHPLFTDHMVFQRGVEAPVWGWTKPGEKVAVAMAGRSAETTADPSGRWSVKLGPFEAGGPHTLTITGSRKVTLSDVLVGDVWLCSGQSNMEMGVSMIRDAKKEIESARHPKIRLFSVPKRIAMEPVETIDARWEECTPETIVRGGWGGFSATGYFFGRKLHADLGVPIGLIHTSWGGTVAEAWTSGEALSAMDDFRPAVEGIRKAARDAKSSKGTVEQRMARWWNDNDPGSKGGWEKPGFKDGKWKTMKLPRVWEQAGLKDYDGIAWFRREVTLPKGVKEMGARLSLGPVDDIDTTWINGKRVGGERVWNHPRTYAVPKGLLRPGRNVIAVRVLDTGGGCGLFGSPDQMVLRIEGAKDVSLAGDWRYAPTTPMAKLPPSPMQQNSNPNVVTVLYNGMLAPLVPFSIRGAIWYQGESNAGRAEQYRRLLPTMIADWRKRFGHDFPFFVVQLANFMEVQKTPVQSGWAELREAQWMTAREDPKVGLAVIIDIGEAADIHPKNKQDVGKRLALSALKIAYGRDVVHSGPEYASMSVKGREVTLTFTSVGGGLEARKGELKGFAIAGADGKFHHAKARIEGKTVIVSSDAVEKPVAVRYGWANNPVCNLVNAEGLPASPFRTDGP